MSDEADNRRKTYASPPCFMHELAGGADTSQEDAWPEVRRWRKATREHLIAERLAIPAAERTRLAEEIAQKLERLIGDPSGRVVGLYWPFRGEPDLRPWLASLHDRGAVPALPVVVQKAAPLTFRPYRPGDRLERGVWNIPVPAVDKEIMPDIIVSPLVGFDAANYRLGYGGGFYDRTIAVLPKRPLLIGIGYTFAEVPTIYPQPHDIPMNHIVVAG
ncbi:5-formyltetrahydrofolate cyclo-ligase [Nitratireductor kimnyeongensis]|uniref:5-formyltetrahydrofolate cyclo-ligase n=1 Tax=Nitratireductor kimnyeongensis TaxID=430679 RepID=A0ABW0TA18_9HYPH|nr:5-formyltetrahydrofolate cyclo-ligase [Nitratireductor kimnyeongensis]QZZ35799.1 5-formyltetrahydrofolate cyclo-ligase [Nitratireductor kimnyeongensis]